MSALREYEVDLGSHVTTMLLDDDAATRYGARAKLLSEKRVETVPNKARRAQSTKSV